jgi:hypothetical protein
MRVHPAGQGDKLNTIMPLKGATPAGIDPMGIVPTN